jgi:hypothetical protein
VESGPREILERLLPALYKQCSAIDVVTCYAGPPQSFNGKLGRIYNTSEYQGISGRKRLYSELWTNSYSAIGILCADSPIMTKWKWAIVAHLPGKLFIINENGDYFWADRGNWRTITRFISIRAGLSGADAVRTLAQLALFPFTVLYLLVYAGWVHAKRRLHA